MIDPKSCGVIRSKLKYNDFTAKDAVKDKKKLWYVPIYIGAAVYCHVISWRNKITNILISYTASIVCIIFELKVNLLLFWIRYI